MIVGEENNRNQISLSTLPLDHTNLWKLYFHITFRLGEHSPWNDLTDNRSLICNFSDKYKTPFVLGSTLRSLTHCFQSEFNVVCLILTVSLRESSFSRVSHSNGITGSLKTRSELQSLCKENTLSSLYSSINLVVKTVQVNSLQFCLLIQAKLIIPIIETLSLPLSILYKLSSSRLKTGVVLFPNIKLYSFPQNLLNFNHLLKHLAIYVVMNTFLISVPFVLLNTFRNYHLLHLSFVSVSNATVPSILVYVPM